MLVMSYHALLHIGQRSVVHARTIHSSAFGHLQYLLTGPRYHQKFFFPILTLVYILHLLWEAYSNM